MLQVFYLSPKDQTTRATQHENDVTTTRKIPDYFVVERMAFYAVITVCLHLLKVRISGPS